MAYRRGGRRHRQFGGVFTPPAATSSKREFSTRKRTCAACKQHIILGEECLRIMIKKAFRELCQPSACVTCGTITKVRRVKRFHIACSPADHNKAMGYDPGVHGTTPPASSAHTATPPPKPPSQDTLDLAALAALEATLFERLRSKGKLTDEVRAAFSKYKKIKDRALRPGTPGEGEVAMNLALQQLVKLAFA